MADFLSYIKQFFSSKAEDRQPVIHEVIDRSEEDQSAFATWLNSKRKDRFLSRFKNSFGARDGLPAAEGLPVQFIEGSTTRGFVLYFDEGHSSVVEFQHFFDFLKHKVKEHAYVSYLSDAKTKMTEEGVELKERHYLKPKPNWNSETKKSDQLYGNITIEHTRLDDTPQHIKFSASYYTDHNFSEALHLDEMLSKILGIDMKKG